MRRKTLRINARLDEKELGMIKEIIEKHGYYGVRTLTDVLRKGVLELYNRLKPTPIEAAGGELPAGEAKRIPKRFRKGRIKRQVPRAPRDPKQKPKFPADNKLVKKLKTHARKVGVS